MHIVDNVWKVEWDLMPCVDGLDDQITTAAGHGCQRAQKRPSAVAGRDMMPCTMVWVVLSSIASTFYS